MAISDLSRGVPQQQQQQGRSATTRRAAANLGFRRVSYLAVVVLGAVAAVCIIAFDSPRSKLGTSTAAAGGGGERSLHAAVRRSSVEPIDGDVEDTGHRVVLRGRRRRVDDTTTAAAPRRPSAAAATVVAPAGGADGDADSGATSDQPMTKPTVATASNSDVSGGGTDGEIPPAMAAERRLLRWMIADNRTVGRSVATWPSKAVSKAFGRRTAKSRPAGSTWPSRPNVAVLSLHVGADEATRNDDPSAKASWLHQISLRNKARYCGRWGYDLIIEKAPPGIGGAKTPREVSWAKIPLLLRYMNLTTTTASSSSTTGAGERRYDWIFWADMDALFTNPKLPLIERLTTLVDGAQHAPDLVVAQDWHGINLGTFLVRNNGATRALLEATWLTAKADWDPFAEQSALIRTLQAAGAGHPADNLKTKTGPRGTVVRMAGGRNAHTLDKTVKAPYAQHAAVTADLGLLPQYKWLAPPTSSNAALAPTDGVQTGGGDGDDGEVSDARPAEETQHLTHTATTVRVQYRQPREMNAYPEAFAYGYVSSMWKDGDLVAHFPNCKGIRTCRGTVERIAHLADRRYEALSEDEGDGGAGAVAARVFEGTPRWVVPEGAMPSTSAASLEDDDRSDNQT